MRANLDGRVGMGGFNALIGLFFCGLAGLALGAQATAAAEASTGNETFQLREVSAFEYGERDFLRGQTTLCEDKPSPKVKAYPARTTFRAAGTRMHIIGMAGDHWRAVGVPNRCRSGLKLSADPVIVAGEIPLVGAFQMALLAVNDRGSRCRQKSKCHCYIAFAAARNVRIVVTPTPHEREYLSAKCHRKAFVTGGLAALAVHDCGNTSQRCIGIASQRVCRHRGGQYEIEPRHSTAGVLLVIPPGFSETILSGFC